MPNYQKLIEETIKSITNQFHRKPQNFFNEHEFHQYCYHRFYKQKEFTEQFTTLDGKKTNILKPEYPTIARFNRKQIKLNPKGSRSKYDMAILDPEFIKANKYISVTNKNIRYSIKKSDTDTDTNNLIAAMEFKYITTHSKAFHHEVKYDLFKLSQASEAPLKYFLLFSNTREREMDYFKGLEIPKGIVVQYVTVWDDDGEKKMRVEGKIIPNFSN